MKGKFYWRAIGWDFEEEEKEKESSGQRNKMKRSKIE